MLQVTVPYIFPAMQGFGRIALALVTLMVCCGCQSALSNHYMEDTSTHDHTYSYARDDTSCIPGSCPRAGLCSTYCRCEEGRWKCCRVRKDFTELDPEELAFFSQTLKRARSHPVVGKWLKKLTIEHETSPIDRVHMHHVILPWHRLALFLLETLIRKHIDCRFTVPYYDFTTHWQDWWRHPPWDAAHLGGNGRGKNCCVEDGPYREGQWSTIFPAGLPNTCLKRYFNRNYSQCSPNILSILFKLASSARDFRSFEMGLNHFAHDRIHHLVGAYMHFGTSINDPTFWVLHSFIDKVFTTWQAQGAEYLEYPYAHSAEVLDLQPASLNFTYADIHDNSNLPHNARVCYSSSHVTSCDGGKYFVPVRPGTAQWSLNKEISASELIYNLTNDETAQLHDVVTFLTDGRRVGASGASAEIRDMGWSDTLPGDCFEGVDADSILTALAEKAKANKPSRP